MDLLKKKCTPCQGGIPPLSPEEIAIHIKKTPQWHVSSNNKSIKRDVKFRNFSYALDFVNKIGEIAENEKHHPDIEFGWGYCNITLQTHSIDGLHENDFIVAAKINQIPQ